MKPFAIHIFNSSIVSGPETLVIPELKNLGFPVEVIFLSETRKGEQSRGPVEYARSFGLTVSEITVRSRWDQKAIRELHALLIARGPSVIHAHDVKASAYTAAASRGIQAKLFSTHHGVRGRSGLTAKLYETIYARLVLKRFDSVLTVCTSDRDILLRRGLREDQVSVHLNGVDRPLVDPSDRSSEAARIRSAWKLGALGIREDSVVMGVIGRIAPEKRIDRALRVLAKLPPDLHWHLVLFGRGPEEAALRDLAHDLGIEDRVHWMGYRNGVGAELAGLDLLLSFSDAEGLPINLIEAGWAGTPVFATAVDGNLDLIPPGSGAGVLVPVEESITTFSRALASLLADGQRREEMGLAFQSRVREHFSGSRWVSELTAFYRAACG